jgi:hypothetical protein
MEEEKKLVDAYVENVGDENITFVLEKDKCYDEDHVNIDNLMSEFNEIKMSRTTYNEEEMDDMYASITDYDENYTIKQLLQICEYYGLIKEIRTAKGKRMDVISALVMFESNSDNGAKVYRRKQLWYYMNELKNDKFMKKFVFW